MAKFYHSSNTKKNNTTIREHLPEWLYLFTLKIKQCHKPSSVLGMQGVNGR